MFLNQLKKHRFILNIRNSLNFRPVPIIFPNNNQKSYSISDAFCWRKSDEFKTDFRYTDLIKYFTNKINTPIKIVLCNHNNKIISELKITPTQLTDKLSIHKKFPKIKETSGHFFLFHKIASKDDAPMLLRNSCYTSFSFKESMPSIVHGNLPVVAESTDSKRYKNDIIQQSFFKKYIYKVQHNFASYDKVEAYLFNSGNRILKIQINDIYISLNPYNSKVINLPLSTLYTIHSKCLLLRPVFFVYKDNIFDVFHG